MAWIKIREDLRTDPAVALIASRTGVTTRHVVGALADVWSWAGRLTADGVVPLATPALLDEVAGSSGFAAAMIEGGWLLATQAGLVFPRWERHNSDQAKERALAVERQRESRARRLSQKSVTPVTFFCDTSVTREEKIREEKNMKGSGAVAPPPRAPRSPEEVPIPEPLRSEAFTAAFREWIEHRKAGWPRDRWTAIAASRKLTELARLGPAEALRWVQFALDEGLKNIQPPFTRGINGGGGGSFGRVAPPKSVDDEMREVFG